jgi:hypothetical protein
MHPWQHLQEAWQCTVTRACLKKVAAGGEELLVKVKLDELKNVAARKRQTPQHVVGCRRGFFHDDDDDDDDNDAMFLLFFSHRQQHLSMLSIASSVCAVDQ